MPEIGLHTNVHTPQTGSVREGGGAAGNGNVQTAPADAEALAMPSQARERARQNMPPLDRHLAGVADPGREGLMKKVGRWFREGFIRTRAGLPETVNVNMPGGGTVNFSGESLAGMIRSLPRLDRASARENLSASPEFPRPGQNIPDMDGAEQVQFLPHATAPGSWDSSSS